VDRQVAVASRFLPCAELLQFLSQRAGHLGLIFMSGASLQCFGALSSGWEAMRASKKARCLVDAHHTRGQ